MERFEIDILGCGSATASLRHQPSAQIVNFRDNLFMIDCGEGAQLMMRRMGLKFNRLSHIFISHMHGDHVLGLPGLLSTMSLHERTGKLTVWLPREGVEVMRSTVNYFLKERSYEIEFRAIPDSGGRIFESHSLTIDAFPLYHRVTAYGFLFREKPKSPHLKGDMIRFHEIPVSALQAIKEGADYVKPDGVRLPNSMLVTPAEPARSYAYCSDTMFDPRVADAVRGVDLLYHEATYHSSRASVAGERGHSTAAEAGRIAAMAGVGRLLIGHFSKRYTDSNILVEDAMGEFPNVTAADEGLKIEV